MLIASSENDAPQRVITVQVSRRGASASLKGGEALSTCHQPIPALSRGVFA
jgi:hypothetical protein